MIHEFKVNSSVVFGDNVTFQAEVYIDLFIIIYIQQGFSRLQKLGMTVCKAVTNRKIAEVALGYNKKVKAWKASVENKRQGNGTAPTSSDPQEEVVLHKCSLSRVMK